MLQFYRLNWAILHEGKRETLFFKVLDKSSIINLIVQVSHYLHL